MQPHCHLAQARGMPIYIYMYIYIYIYTYIYIYLYKSIYVSPFVSGERAVPAPKKVNKKRGVFRTDIYIYTYIYI